ncbi:unnamed protein product [Rotaria magnacalcarata]|uniref:Calmodulin-binding domain-containing protein n=3 Tax=Rotaria magnacalcarata TaxID=392030 RepID=A0A8S2JEN2_9BILA|nr:unnamed protein product [Rotaria magnacalcarata]CAF3859014.1 unnamed protein product [Rotaria magnacalcarata]CAF3877411.1 unnamed protein product [Rotaria magnacalcarata]
MTSVEHRSIVLNFPVPEDQPNANHIECSHKVPLKSVSIISRRISQLSLHSRRSSKQSNETISENKLRQKSILKRRSGKTLSMELVSYGLSRRRKLHVKCRQVNDIMCAVSFLGIILMIIDNEIAFARFDHHETISTWLLKLTITISSMVLIGLVLYYHYYEINLYCANNSIEHWRVGLTGKKLLSIILEIVICSIHPIPRHFPIGQYSHDERNIVNSTKSYQSTAIPIALTYVPVDVALGLPMFGRLYLWCRYITFHSRLARDTSLQSLGYLNKISIDFIFVIKTYFQQWPIRCLVIFCTMVFLIGSWSLRACDVISDNEHISIFAAMWLFIVTFTTVGYGDVTPATYCGRSVATIASIIGILVSALLIAVVSQKLIMSRWERYVHNFVLNCELAKARKHQAANIIINAWKMWRLTKMHKYNSIQYIQSQQAFFKSIDGIKYIKQKQRKLNDNIVGLAELLMIQRGTSTVLDQSVEQMNTMKQKIDSVDEKLDAVNQTVHHIQNTLSLLLDRITPLEMV